MEGNERMVMRKILFATTNRNKLKEVRQMLHPRGMEIVGLDEMHFDGDIPEDHDTLEANALQKAEHVYRKYGVPCFSEDTGLEVKALGGRPGVYSARYAGPQKSSLDNMRKLMRELEKQDDRKAQFKTVIVFKTHDKVKYFTGRVTGQIARVTMGDSGFGYDPIFVPDGFQRSFGQLDSAIKNRISHRAKAWRKLVGSF